jgi:hypothetical protein
MVVKAHRFLQVHQFSQCAPTLKANLGRKYLYIRAQDAAVGSDFVGRNLASVQQLGEVRARNAEQVGGLLRSQDFGAGLKAVQ